VCKGRNIRLIWWMAALCLLLSGGGTGIARGGEDGETAALEERVEGLDESAEPSPDADSRLDTRMYAPRDDERRGEEDLIAPLLFEPKRLGADRLRLQLAGTAVDRSLAASSAFLAHRGAGARVATFPTSLAPPQPLQRREYGPWAVAASLSVYEQFTDNVFLTPNNEQSEWTTVVGPSVGVEWSQPDFRLAMHYGGQYFYPDRFSSENERDDHQIILQGEWQLRRSLVARAEYVAGWRTVMAGFEGDKYTRYRDSVTAVGLNYSPWDDWRFDLGYDRYNAQFRENQTDDVTAHGFTAEASRRLFPAVWGQARLRYVNTENHDLGVVDTDNDMYTASFGLKFDPLAPVTGTMHVGYTIKDFDSSLIDDQGTIYMEGGLTYEPRDWIHLFFTARSTVEDTSTVALNQPVPAVASLARSGFSLGGRFDVTDRWGLSMLGFYAMDEYATPSDREDDLWGGTFSAYYKISEKARLTLRYQYQQNDSTQNASDFTENFVQLGVDVTF